MSYAQRFFTNYLGLNAYPHQVKVFEFFWNHPNEGMSLFAPTGSGKTEAAVAPFLNQFVTNDFRIAPRLIYVLPTQALCNKLCDRLREYARRVSGKIVVEVHHGSHPADPFFMADIVVTTLDQLIYAYARASNHVGRHLDFPSGSIASSLLAFDEAHMYQSPYTFSILRAFLEIVNASGIPFILMTATMPDSLLADFSKTVPSLGRNSVTSRIQPFKRRLSVRLEKLGEDRSIIPANIMDTILDSDSVLIVANTVDRAKRIHRAIMKERPDSLLIHSRFTVRDRHRKEDGAYEKLRKDGSGGIVVSTQICEAGLDISCRLLVTDLAPADSLVQRFGRCARFGGEGTVYVLFPEVEDSDGMSRGSITSWSAPYEAEHLKASLEFLAKGTKADYTDGDVLSQFVNRFRYEVSDSEAADSLVDLFDATIYAESRPRNLQVREGKPLFLWIGEKKDLFASGSGEFKQNLMSLEYGMARRIMNRNKEIFGPKPCKIYYDWQQRKLAFREENQIVPFSQYIGNPCEYSPEEGLKEE